VKLLIDTHTLIWALDDPTKLIIAQALVEGVSIVGADPVFDAYGITRIW
jgi:PIN domain nuclease of toxin-antitoxin system